MDGVVTSEAKSLATLLSRPADAALSEGELDLGSVSQNHADEWMLASGLFDRRDILEPRRSSVGADADEFLARKDAPRARGRIFSPSRRFLGWIKDEALVG
ncbi:MAG: hypothetical protein ACJ76X_16725 [Solirubrobacteraceae bacterium]